jgi:death-on-curing protein
VARYISLDEALAIHAHQISRYGGTSGIRDRALLESALAMPKATFGGDLLHPSLAEQAAAYVFHLVKNHPFIDGNKRVGLACGLVFLRLNGLRLMAGEDELTDLVIGIAAEHVSKAEAAVYIASHI